MMTDNETVTEYFCEECGETSKKRHMHCGKVMVEKEVEKIDETTRKCPDCGGTYHVGSKHNCPAT